MANLLPGGRLIGIDERTAMVDDGPGGAWQVYGQGAVTLYHDGQTAAYQAGHTFRLDDSR